MTKENKMITGYQYNPQTGAYIGPYSFPNNEDKKEIHLPPCTVLESPGIVPAGKLAFYVNGAWEFRGGGVIPSHPPIDDYSMLRDEAVELMRKLGSWTAADQAALDSVRGAGNAD